MVLAVVGDSIMEDEERVLIISPEYTRRRIRPEMVISEGKLYYDMTEAFFKSWEIGLEPRLVVESEKRNGKRTDKRKTKSNNKRSR